MKNKQGGFGEVIVIAMIAVALGLLVWGIVVDSGNPVVPKPKTEEQTVAEIQKNIVTNVPIPQITTSQERLNVSKRAELFNNENKISYIYLVNYGKVMAFYTVKGKVSSLRSYMSPMQKVIRANGKACGDDYNSSSYCFVVDAPDIDGTYGENVEGVFFFTTDGAYVEWRGDYMMSDQPLRLTTQPELVRTIK